MVGSWAKPLEGEGRLASREARCETGWGEGLSSSPVFQRLGRSLARTIQLDIDPLEYRVQIFRDLRIPEPDNAISLLLKPKLSFTIALGCFVVIMMTAVEFDDEMGSWTQEVYNIRADRRLSSEVRAVYRQFLQSAP